MGDFLCIDKVHECWNREGKHILYEVVWLGWRSRKRWTLSKKRSNRAKNYLYFYFFEIILGHDSFTTSYVRSISCEVIDLWRFSFGFLLCDRFSDFTELRDTLLRRFAVVKQISFPRKRVFSRVTIESIQQRRDELEAWLRAITAVPEIVSWTSNCNDGVIVSNFSRTLTFFICARANALALLSHSTILMPSPPSPHSFTSDWCVQCESKELIAFFSFIPNEILSSTPNLQSEIPHRHFTPDDLMRVTDLLDRAMSLEGRILRQRKSNPRNIGDVSWKFFCLP
jgi:hypothetical protein